jgi:hypothetical protein
MFYTKPQYRNDRDEYASFRIHKGNKKARLDPQPGFDKYGNKLGFITEPIYRTMQNELRTDTNEIEGHSMYRTHDVNEPEINYLMPNTESLFRNQRNNSQPNLPKASTMIDIKLNRKESYDALPVIPANPKDRIFTPSYVGEEAYSNFYKKFRRLSKEKEVSAKGYSATTAYLTSCDTLKMVPNPIGILKWDGNENEINVSNYFMGKKYALALSSSMKYLKTEKLNLRSNNLGSNGSIAIIENLSHVLTDLDLSKNKMGDEAMQKLVAWLEDMPNKCKLKFLNLSANKFSDSSLFQLGEAMTIANPPLKLLDLSHNKLEQTACRSLGDFIRHEASELIILRLQWNRIHSDGAIYLFDAICNNTSIKNFDVSWNMLGTKNYKKNAEVMLKLANLVN